MPKIKILDDLLASKIAAGEVVDRPSSVVKELMENSLDAGAASIAVHIAEGGMRLIRVVDNGEGMTREDAPLAFLRHATSKIKTEDDLDAIRTMGFRGEALSSISAVSRVTLKTKKKGDLAGTLVIIEGSVTPLITDDGCPEGTAIEIKDLFFNTPARLKFMRSTDTEYGKVLDIFKKIALVNPDKRFKLVNGSSTVIDAAPGTLKDRIASLFGSGYLDKIIEVRAPNLKGFLGTHELSFSTAKALYTYVNGRPVRDKGVNRAIINGYGALLDGRFPFAVINLMIDPEDVDVNIHPAKSEVRFKSPRLIYDTVKAAVKIALGSSLIKREAAYGDTGGVLPEWKSPVMNEPERVYAATERGLNNTPQAARPEETLKFSSSEKEVKNPEFIGLEVVGQLWGEFLIAERNENGGEFYIIDAHGAAERCAFERLKKEYYSSTVKNQLLLIPERFETTPEERDSVNAAMPYLERMGFEITPFGPSTSMGGETFLIKATPALLTARESKMLVKDVSEELSGFGGSSKIEEQVESVLMRIACHSVIRGKRILSRDEGRALLTELAGVDFAGHCPHGRPVVKRFSRAEVETMFKR